MGNPKHKHLPQHNTSEWNMKTQTQDSNIKTSILFTALHLIQNIIEAISSGDGASLTLHVLFLNVSSQREHLYF